MTLKEFREGTFDYFSGKTSDIARQLSLAGIGIIWVFKEPDQSGSLIPEVLVSPVILIMLSLMSDFCQYLYGTIAWHLFFKHHERKGSNDDTILDAPSWMNYATWFFFILKIALLIAAYIFIVRFLYLKV